MRRFIAILFSSFFYPVLVVYTLVAVVVFTLYMVVTAPFFSHVKNMCRFRWLMCQYGVVIIRVLARPVISISYQAVPRDPKIAKIVVANHISASDPYLTGCLPEVFVHVVNTWPFKLPILGFFARWAGYVNIKKMTPEAFVEACAKLLREGTTVVAFPEGTRAGEGPMGPFHSAVFRVALATKVPIVPMCIYGNARSPARGSLILEPATVRVHCLPEVTWDIYQSMTPFQLKNYLRDLIQQEVERMKTL
ncbi:MAG: lysophospholipid acyltransferase family protein [bacterium]